VRTGVGRTRHSLARCDLSIGQVGDAMLARLGQALAVAAAPWGTSYRLGGDEFCVLAEVPAAGADELVEASRDALTERADGLEITASLGMAMLAEGTTVSDVLRLADRRLYAGKLQRWLAGAGRAEELAGRTLNDQAEVSA
jgi:diguanylate cyclase (GGDEF)-like protein